MQNQQEAEDEATGGGLSVDALKSYGRYAFGAVRNHALLALGIFVLGVGLTITVVALWPRTYHCETRLLAQRSKVLEDDQGDPFPGASDVILRSENLIAITERSHLAKTWASNRPLLLKLKDRLLGRVVPEKEIVTELSRVLGARLWVKPDNNTLTVGIDWQEPKMAAELVEAGRDSYLETRHNSEVSTVQDKISILNEHAEQLRAEIDRTAAELQHIREQTLADVTTKARELRSASAPPTEPQTPARRTTTLVPAHSPEELSQLKEQLDAKRARLTELETEQRRSLADAQTRLTDLKLKLTPEHPDVRAAEQKIQVLSEESPATRQLRGEVKELEAQLRTDSAAKIEGGSLTIGSSPRNASAPASDTLPPQVLGLLQQNSADIDPIVGTQLRSSIAKYAELRDQIRAASIQLDTAQAAFNHRYKIVMPAEVPTKPDKPKVPAVLGAGFAVALLLSLIVPLLLELRTGLIVETWQVSQLGLPVLGELRLPPRPPGRG